MSYPAEAISSDTITIQIGGIPILLRCEDPVFLRNIEERYAGFVVPSDREIRYGNPVDLTIELLPAGELQGDEDVRVWRKNRAWHLQRGDFRVEWDPGSGRGRLRQEANPYGLNSVLRILHTLMLAPRGGFLLHAASAVRNGHAFVFSGVSGAGKTTISRLAPDDAVLLTDEISYITRNGSEYAAWGTPFPGDLGVSGKNVCAPIRNLFLLNKGSENRIEPIEAGRALALLMRNILFFSTEPEMVEMAFAAACDFIHQVPARQLTFIPDASVWEHLH